MLTISEDGRGFSRREFLTIGSLGLGGLTLASLLAVSMFGLMLGQGVFVKYAADELGLGSAGYGVLLACAISAAAGIGDDRRRDELLGSLQQLPDAMREVRDTLADAVEESVQNRPFTTLAMALAAGFVIGAIWRR